MIYEELINSVNNSNENSKYLLKIPKTYYPEDLYFEKIFDNKTDCLTYIDFLINDIVNDRDLCTDVDRAKICRYVANNLQEYLKGLIPNELSLTDAKSFLESFKSHISNLQIDLTYNEYSVEYIFNKYSKKL